MVGQGIVKVQQAQLKSAELKLENEKLKFCTKVCPDYHNTDLCILTFSILV